MVSSKGLTLHSNKKVSIVFLPKLKLTRPFMSALACNSWKEYAHLATTGPLVVAPLVFIL